MNKSILFISVLSLLLSGCGEKKITEDFLQGKWQCKPISSESASYDGEYKSDLKDDDKNNVMQFEFKKQNHVFMQIMKRDNRVERSSSFRVDMLPFINQSFQYETGRKMFTDYVYLSNNTFQIVLESETYTVEDETSPWILESKSKKIAECTRE